MKFEDLLMQPSDQEKEKQRRVNLEDEQVEKLQEELDAELKLSKILHCALQGPVHSCACLSKLIPAEVQVLFAEIATIEEDIVWLEIKMDKLKSRLYQEKKQINDHKLAKVSRKHRKHMKLLSYSQGNRTQNSCRVISRSQDFAEHGQYKSLRERQTSCSSSEEVLCLPSMKYSDDIAASSKPTRSLNSLHFNIQIVSESANQLSEEMIKCLIVIFLKLKHPCSVTKGGSSKHNSLSRINTKAFISKTTFSCKAPVVDTYDNASSNMDVYGVIHDWDGLVRSVGPYKGFIQVTRNSLDMTRVSLCFQELGKLRVLASKLHSVDLTVLTYKQKLAFWINIYNACIMHAFLQHGLPSTHENLLSIMNKAALNVGGIVLNALAIEHFILRHPSESNHGPMDENEILLRHVYGLGYPEPYVTFALCRGTWSSPALRVYTPNEVVNELERAKVEYLGASVGVTSKKRIVVPKLLQWHMKDFADDLESLLEWIYSQLPNHGPLKRSIMECLIGETKSTLLKMVQVQPYDSEFRYLFPSYAKETQGLI